MLVTRTEAQTAYLLRASVVEMERWKSEARRVGVPFSVWLRRLCDAACR